MQVFGQEVTMQAVVKAAGRGSRLRPQTDEKPKGMVEIGGRPLLAHLLERIGETGIDEVVMVVGYRRNAIIEHFGQSFGELRLCYAVQEEHKGVAHATACAEPFVDGDFLSLPGDVVFSKNPFEAALRRYQDTETEMTTLVERVTAGQARKTAVFEFDESNRIDRVVEKPAEPPSRCVPAGFYILPPAVFDACRRIEPSERGEYEITDAVNLLLHEGYRMSWRSFDGWRINVNTPRDLERARQQLAADD